FSLEGSPITQLREGITVLAATLSSEYAVERMGHGVFTKLLCQGLEGVSADILGHVTAASLYNLADSMLSPWEQRPVYKSFVNKMKPLRYCLPKIPKKALRRINQHFPQPDASIQLSESFLEHTRQATPSDVGLFKELLDYESVGLVQGRMAKTLTSEAEIQGTCILTEYGKLFWQTVAKGLV
ncbi:MAG: caspase family protein, partial [Bacteroidota bacterium]